MRGISLLAAKPVTFSRRTLLHVVSKYPLNVLVTSCREVSALCVRLVVHKNIKHRNVHISFKSLPYPVGSNKMSPKWFNFETLPRARAGANVTRSRPCTKQSNPFTVLDRPTQFQQFEAPWFQDSRHVNVVMLLALRTDRLYPPGNIGTHFC